MSEPKGRAARTVLVPTNPPPARGTSDEGRQRIKSAPEASAERSATGTATARPVRPGPRPARGALTPSRARLRVSPGRVLVFVLATGWLVVVLAPVYYMVLASFRSQGTYLTANPWLPGGGLTLF